MLKSMLFHHIGIATNSIINTSSYYIEEGYTISEIIFDPIQNVNIAFLTIEGSPLIELVEPIDEKSPVSQIIKKCGVSPYHICYQVDNINNVIIELKKKNYLLLFKPVKAVALFDKKICFLYNKHIGLIELLEK